MKIHDNEVSKKKRKALVDNLSGVVRPRPNSKFLGIRLKLSLYNLAGTKNMDKKKGLRHWLRTKAGEPPVLESDVHLDVNKKLMINYMENRGYFQATVKAHWDSVRRKKTSAIFDINTGPQYTINKVEFEKDSTLICADIDSDFSKTMLQPGQPYNLDVIKAERQRIDRMLKEKGYFYFKPDYVLVLVDSSIGNYKVNMYVKLKKKEIPDEAYNIYDINDIYIFTNYNLRNSGRDTSMKNKVLYDNYNIIDNQHAYKPRAITDAMIFTKGDEYSLDDQNTSLSRLVNMGTFKFVKNRFDAVNDSQLDVYYYLTPFPKKSVTVQLGALTQSDDRNGIRGSISWKNRNTFKGAEELVFKVHAGIETQYGGAPEPPIVDMGAEADLSFPRFVVPFLNINTEERYLPRSIIKLKADKETELNLLTINSYTASYGYDWKVGSRQEHQFYPFNFTYVRTDTLQSSEVLSLLYSALLFNGIILGPTYEYTYNSQIGAAPKSGFYFDGLVDLADNVLGIAQRANYMTNPQTLFGTTYAQYVKLQPDLRYYLHVSKGTTIASRMLVGVGVPYGNSSALPNIKEFWAGGNSDLRGFPSRLVGPGTFNEAVTDPNTQYLETLGDLKLEFNTEWRQNVYKFINTALFFDAGNIWLYHSNPAFPGGEFSSRFLSQLACDAGIGLRLDFSILLVRLDVGVPVAEPWLNPPGYSALQNVVYNIAIGYPF